MPFSSWLLAPTAQVRAGSHSQEPRPPATGGERSWLQGFTQDHVFAASQLGLSLHLPVQPLALGSTQMQGTHH